jgi:hypothetical protein
VPPSDRGVGCELELVGPCEFGESKRLAYGGEYGQYAGSDWRGEGVIWIRTFFF